MATLTNQPIDQPTDRANIVQTAFSKVGEQKAEICNFKPMQSIRCDGVHRTIRKECPTLSPEAEANQIFCTINVLHCTTQALQSFISFFSQMQIYRIHPSVEFYHGARMERQHIGGKISGLADGQMRRYCPPPRIQKAYTFVGRAFWEAIKNQSHRICGPCASNETETEKSNKLDSIGPIEDQQKTWMCSMDHLSFPNIAKSTNDPRH